MARLAVVVSQGRSPHPEKRKREEELVARLLGEADLEVLIVPHLYDFEGDEPARLGLEGIQGPLVVLAWLYPRAAFWTLDRLGIRGTFGRSRLHEVEDEEEEGSAEGSEIDGTGEDQKPEEPRPGTVLAEQPHRRGSRPIYCLDLGAPHDIETLVEEIRRIAGESRLTLVGLTGLAPSPSSPAPASPAEAPPRRRWYPGIDYSRCTNCMECIDFCLFGVYGVDAAETILVEQPDNCRLGCPACSRVCPENAIIFPQHKSAAIAGAPVEGPSSLKIDLSKLFGAPDARALAAQERDEQLRLAGRAPVGSASASTGTGATAGPTETDRPVPTSSPGDELDALLDELDAFDTRGH